MNSYIDIIFDYKRARPKKSEVSGLLCNNKKFTKYFNWKPKYSGRDGLKKGIIKTIEWFKANKNFYTQTSKFIK